MTTLSELRNRADLVVLLGTDGVSVNPRFAERCLLPAPRMRRHPQRARQVVVIGEPGQARALKKSLPAATGIPCRPPELLELLSALQGMLRGQEEILAEHRPLSGRRPALRRLVEQFRSAEYCVLVWAPGQFPAAHADIIIETICDLVTEMNETTRAAGLALGGSNGAVTAMNVCAWQTGYPLRVNFAGGAPQYNPSRNSSDALLERREADALVWISAFHPLPPPRLKRAPTVVLAAPSRKLAAGAEVYFPVAIPGVDAAGSLFRLDSVVALPLRAVRGSSLPTTAEILNRIASRI